jgi:hypothetical protein
MSLPSSSAATFVAAAALCWALKGREVGLVGGQPSGGGVGLHLRRGRRKDAKLGEDVVVVGVDEDQGARLGSPSGHYWTRGAACQLDENPRPADLLGSLGKRCGKLANDRARPRSVPT